MIFLAQSELEFFRVQGSETAMSHQLLSGHIPFLSGDSVTVGLWLGLGLLLLVAMLTMHVQRLRARGRLSRWTFVLLQVVLFVGFFASWEAALAGRALRPSETFVPDPLTFWRANPWLQEEGKREGTAVVGMRGVRPVTGLFDQDHSGPKPPGTWRLLFLGDSQSISTDRKRYGAGATYSKRLDREGLQGPGGQRVEVINGGISGFSSWQGLMMLRSDLLGLEPDVVVEAFGYHDANPALSHDREVLTDDPLVHRVRTLMYRSRVCLLLRTLILRRKSALNDRSDSREWVPRVPPAQFETNLRAFVDLGREHGFRVVFLQEPVRDPRVWARGEEHRGVARRLGDELGVPVIDVFTPFERMDPQEREALFEDGIHLNPQGHALVAEIVQRRLIESGLLREAP